MSRFSNIVLRIAVIVTIVGGFVDDAHALALAQNTMQQPTTPDLPKLNKQQQDLIKRSQQRDQSSKLVEKLTVENEKLQEQINNSVSFVLRGITIKGNETLPQNVLRQLIEPEINQSADSNKLKQVAYKITRLLALAGHGTSKAFVPPQQVKNGVVEIQIETDKLAGIQVLGKNSFRYNDDIFFQYFSDLKGKVIHLPTIEQRLKYLTFLPSAKIKPTLRKIEFGQSVLLLVLEEQDSYSNLTFSDNSGKYNGDLRLTGATSIINPTGRGDTLNAFLIVNPEYPKYFSSLFGRYSLPYGSQGAKFNLSYSSIDYQFDSEVLGEASQFLMYTGQSEQISLFYDKPILIDYGNFNLQFGLERRYAASQEVNLYVEDNSPFYVREAGFKTRDQKEQIYAAKMTLNTFFADNIFSDNYPAQTYMSLSYLESLEGLWGSLTQEEIDLKTLNTNAGVSPELGPVGDTREAVANFWKVYFSFSRTQALSWQMLLRLDVNIEHSDFVNIPSSYKYGGADTGVSGGDWALSLNRSFNFSSYVDVVNLEVGYQQQIAVNTFIPDSNVDRTVQTCGGLDDLVIWQEYQCEVSSPFVSVKLKSDQHFFSAKYVAERQEFETLDKKLTLLYSYSF